MLMPSAESTTRLVTAKIPPKTRLRISGRMVESRLCLMDLRLLLGLAGHGDAGGGREGLKTAPEEAADHPAGDDGKADAL